MKKYISPYYSFIGRDIKIIRKNYRLNQKQFAKLLGVTSSAISRWEAFDYYKVDMLYTNKQKLKQLLINEPYE